MGAIPSLVSLMRFMHTIREITVGGIWNILMAKHTIPSTLLQHFSQKGFSALLCAPSPFRAVP
jgi:hypothetical protein